jgi:hypothetical protein
VAKPFFNVLVTLNMASIKEKLIFIRLRVGDCVLV